MDGVKDCDRDYAEQVTAEHKISERTANGRIATKWIQKSSHADNHYLDAEVYCMAAADMLGVRTMSLQEDTPAPPASPTQNKETQENPWLSGFDGIKNNDDGYRNEHNSVFHYGASVIGYDSKTVVKNGGAFYVWGVQCVLVRVQRR